MLPPCDLSTFRADNPKDNLVDYFFNRGFVVGEDETARNRLDLAYVATRQAGIEHLLQSWVSGAGCVRSEVVEARGAVGANHHAIGHCRYVNYVHIRVDLVHRVSESIDQPGIGGCSSRVDHHSAVRGQVVANLLKELRGRQMERYIGLPI